MASFVIRVDRARALRRAVTSCCWIAVVAVAVLLPSSAAARGRRAPVPYVIHAYLEPAPEGVKVIDRIDIAASGKPTRWLAVTSYKAAGPVSLSGYLSRSMRHPWKIAGKQADVDRLLDASPGTEIEGQFLVYTSGAPILHIAEIHLRQALPAPAP